jgi:hypothetical protein
MGLDVYVMPLWRFKTGRFVSPAEAHFGAKAKTLAVGTDVEVRTRVDQPSVSWLTKLRAKRDVRRIQKAVSRANRLRIHWRDEGDVIYSQQSPGIEPLRAFAKWLDYRDQMHKFLPPPESNYYKHPVWELEGGRSLSCPQLVGHGCFNGYFLPADFTKVVEVEPYQVHSWEFSRSVGSAVQLRQELGTLIKTLDVPDDYCWSAEDMLAPVKVALVQLRQVAALSCEHGLPIILWG